MRESVALLLPHETVTAPAGEQLATLTATLRGHMELLIPEVEQIATQLPADDVPRYCALACVGEARGKLSAQVGPGRTAHSCTHGGWPERSPPCATTSRR
ncbi:DUF6415 family natural product biosynthesis protein [Streptomyces sp. NPDC001340]